VEERDLVLPHVLREYIGKMYWVRWSLNFRVTEFNKTKTTTQKTKNSKTQTKEQKLKVKMTKQRTKTQG